MKALKLLALLLALVMAIGILASCSKKTEQPAETVASDTTSSEEQPTEPEIPATFADILNTEYSPSTKVMTSLAAIDGLNNYTVNTATSEFVLFEKDVQTEEGYYTNYKLFSFCAGKVVRDFSNTANITYTLFDFADYCPLLKVTKRDASSGTVVYTYSLYDTSGQELAKRASDFTITPSYFNDWIIFENEIYEMDKSTGALSKKANVPANLDIVNFDYKNQSYLYDMTYSKVTVYDHNFNVVAIYSYPAEVEMQEAIATQAFPLNDGNVLIQYVIPLPENASEYDISSTLISDDEIGTAKFDITTEIFSVTEKTSKPLDFNYMISNLLSYNVLAQDQESIKQYATGKFENVISVYSIEDKKLPNNENLDFFFMANDGTLGKSLKLVEYQTGLPEKVATDIYKVPTQYGHALVDVNGKLLNQMTDDKFYRIGDYYVTTYAIYDLSFNLVYDFSANNAVLLNNPATDLNKSTIFVKQYASADNMTDYSILAFSNGEQKEICKYAVADTNHNVFTYADEFYYILNTETSTYTYYNAVGSSLTTTNNLDWDMTNSKYSDEYSCRIIRARDLATTNYTWYLLK